MNERITRVGRWMDGRLLCPSGNDDRDMHVMYESSKRRKVGTGGCGSCVVRSNVMNIRVCVWDHPSQKEE